MTTARAITTMNLNFGSGRLHAWTECNVADCGWASTVRDRDQSPMVDAYLHLHTLHPDFCTCSEHCPQGEAVS